MSFWDSSKSTETWAEAGTCKYGYEALTVWGDMFALDRQRLTFVFELRRSNFAIPVGLASHF